MKVLYIGSQALREDSLALDREVQALQERLVEHKDSRPVFVFLPGSTVEDLEDAIARNRPDIVHISSHGGTNGIELSTRTGAAIAIDATKLLKAFGRTHMPRLVYLNACESHDLANRLVGRVPMAIGMTAPISNGAARAAAVRFYERLLKGHSVQIAHDGAQWLVDTIDGDCSTHLASADGIDPASEIMVPVLQIVAKIVRHRKGKRGLSYFDVRVGAAQCPNETRQLVIFTDHDDFARTAETFESDLCWVVREIPANGRIWARGEWPYFGDFRMYAMAVTPSGYQAMAQATLCEALENFARMERLSPSDTDLLQTALVELRKHDGRLS